MGSEVEYSLVLDSNCLLFPLETDCKKCKTKKNHFSTVATGTEIIYYSVIENIRIDYDYSSIISNLEQYYNVKTDEAGEDISIQKVKNIKESKTRVCGDEIIYLAEEDIEKIVCLMA